MKDLSLEAIRLAGTRILLLMICALAAAVGATWLGLGRDGGVGYAFGVAVALCLYPATIVAGGRTDAEARLALSVTSVAMPSLLLFAARDMAWQTDIHMIFFAALAMTAILCDWKALVAAAALVAVHHLVIGMLLPAWVFDGESSLPRILFHAAVLLAEAGALVWISARIVVLIELVELRQHQQAAMAAAHDAERQASMTALEQTIATFGGALGRLGDGDLTAEIEGEIMPAHSALKTDFNRALSSLRQLIGTVSRSAAAIRVGSSEIAQASEDLARRTEVSAASLGETAASVTQVNNRLGASTAAAAHTVDRADRAIATVGSGRAIADEVVKAMGRVSESAEGIDAVIEGLDRIAFQTRVLAMNAAVEAGRAGDAGRGFAVVADLVSALALRAEEEAKRAREQLTVTQVEVAAAAQTVRKVDAALAEIEGDVGEVHGLLASMAADNRAQSAAIGRISSTVSCMDQATQQNAAMVEETSAAARSLAVEVDALAERASYFVVDAPERTSTVGAGRLGSQRRCWDSDGPLRHGLPQAIVPA